MNGAPRIAPTPISSECASPENRMAMIGIIVSGSAVPTAANTDPTAPSARPSLRPNHSMPFVNSSAPARMMTKEATRIRRSMVLACQESEKDADRDDGEDEQGDPGESLLAAAPEAEERAEHPQRGRRQDADDPDPEEAGGTERFFF